jgi:hypothetical protein
MPYTLYSGLRQYATFLFALTVDIINITFKALKSFLAESCVISLLIALRRFNYRLFFVCHMGKLLPKINT